MHRIWLCVAVVACGGAPSSPSSPSNSLAAAPSPRSTATRCSALMRAGEPLSRSDLELASASSDIALARQQLVGVWDGHFFALEGELGQPGPAPQSERADLMCFGVSGNVLVAAAAPSRPDCKPYSRSYTLQRDDEMGGMLVLEVSMTGGCPGDAGHEQPYVHPYYVNRLDETFLVLIDGVTGTVSGYRRR